MAPDLSRFILNGVCYKAIVQVADYIRLRIELAEGEAIRRPPENQPFRAGGVFECGVGFAAKRLAGDSLDALVCLRCGAGVQSGYDVC